VGPPEGDSSGAHMKEIGFSSGIDDRVRPVRCLTGQRADSVLPYKNAGQAKGATVRKGLEGWPASEGKCFPDLGEESSTVVNMCWESPNSSWLPPRYSKKKT